MMAVAFHWDRASSMLSCLLAGTTLWCMALAMPTERFNWMWVAPPPPVHCQVPSAQAQACLLLSQLRQFRHRQQTRRAVEPLSFRVVQQSSATPVEASKTVLLTAEQLLCIPDRRHGTLLMCRRASWKSRCATSRPSGIPSSASLPVTHATLCHALLGLMMDAPALPCRATLSSPPLRGGTTSWYTALAPPPAALP